VGPAEDVGGVPGVGFDLKAALGISALLTALFLGFAYFHSNSVDRAHLVNTANELLIARKQLHRHGAITNASANTRVYPFTNEVTLGGIGFICELAANVPGLTNVGTLVITTDGTLIWIDLRTGPAIVRRPDGKFTTPERFRDF
jgi:hypothetical protein